MAHVAEPVDVALPCVGAVLTQWAIDWRTKKIVIVRTSAAHAVPFLKRQPPRKNVKFLEHGDCGGSPQGGGDHALVPR